MSPTILILSALLLSLISGSTEGGQRLDPVALLRQTLRYWRKIYKTYHEEVALGYCWADYLLEISGELSANLSAVPLVGTGDRDAVVGATKSQRNPFPQNVMTDTTTMLRETRERKRLRDKQSRATTRSDRTRFANDSDKQRIISRVIIIQEKWIMKKVLPIIANNEKSSKIDGNKRITPMIDLYIQKKTFSTSPKLFHEQREVSRDHEFLSCEMYPGTVNPTPNPKVDDKVGYESTDVEENTRRESSHSHSTHHRDSLIKDISALRDLFLLAITRDSSLGNYRFREERNSRLDDLLPDPRTSREDRGTKRNPVGDRVPLNKHGSSLSPSRFQGFRGINAVTTRSTGIVKLTNSVANSSCNPGKAINSGVPRRKPEELSRDSLLLLLPGGEKVGVAERSSLESRGSGREAVKGNSFSRFGEMAKGGDGERRRPRVEKGSRIERDVAETRPGTKHPPFPSRLERSRQQMIRENRVLFPSPTGGSKRDDDRIQAAKNRAPSLTRVGRFIDNYENSTHESVKNPRLSLRSVVITIFRTLGIFVQVGRQIMDVVESNTGLACTKEYLWTKIIRWIDA